MSPRLAVARAALAGFAALTLAACDSSTPTAATPQPPAAAGLALQAGRPDQPGPPFIQSLNALTGNVQFIAGQNVAITSDAEARTLTLDVSTQSSTPAINIVRQVNNVIPAGMMNSAIAISCFPAGSKVVSGGFAFASAGGQVYSSYPNSSAAFGERWIVQIANPTAAPISVDVYAVCVS
jgi:hypothetical protein